MNSRRNILRQSGSSMIEVLVTLIILLVGLLGLAGVMVQGQRSELESYQRVQALILLQDMVGRINANRASASCYALSNANGAPSLGTGIATSAVAAVANCTTQASGFASDTPTNSISNITSFCTTNNCTTNYCSPAPISYNTPPSCNAPTQANAQASAQAAAMAQSALGTPRATADLQAWNNQLLGAAETSGGGNTGAMVGARGCINYNAATQLNDSTGATIPGTGIYTVSVAWQGMGKTFANTSLLCGQGLYGDEAQRRVVSLPFRIGSKNNN